MVVFNHKEQLYQSKTESWKTHRNELQQKNLWDHSLHFLATRKLLSSQALTPRTFLTRKGPVPCKCVEAQGQFQFPGYNIFEISAQWEKQLQNLLRYRSFRRQMP